MNSKHTNIRTKKQVAEDLITIQEKLKEGYSWRRIGNYINSTRDYHLSHVTYYIQYNDFVSKLNAKAEVSREQYVQMQLSEIEELKTELWNSWLLSKGEQEIKTIKNVSEQEIETTTKEWEDAGGVNYLTLYTKLLERESKLLGLDSPIKNEHTGKDGAAIEVKQITGMIVK